LRSCHPFAQPYLLLITSQKPDEWISKPLYNFFLTIFYSNANHYSTTINAFSNFLTISTIKIAFLYIIRGNN